jgi:hypothetical protein
MENNEINFIIELINNEQMVNSYTLPNNIFLTTNQNGLILSLTEIFNKMIDDLTYSTKLDIIGNWDSVTYYKLSGDVKSSEIIKTKSEMDQYPSYGEGILIVFNTITQP